MTGKILFIAGFVVLCVGIVVGMYFLLAHVLMWAWSISVVHLFHWPELSFWPAVGILVLLAFLGVGTYKGNGGRS